MERRPENRALLVINDIMARGSPDSTFKRSPLVTGGGESGVIALFRCTRAETRAVSAGSLSAGDVCAHGFPQSAPVSPIHQNLNFQVRSALLTSRGFAI
ncbi:hypothetical protein AAFF_G00094920 [Aldrovandia affinis]|uniref:Uncharacterized protein n=1 Tax=Aldrovandia affinis TaxID=143900 RepID=A0AAD7RVV6_9TELE|nr:hypothetical protein AAFF_G00094920 [Aldrovandia affinis]